MECLIFDFWMPLPPCRNELERVARGQGARWGSAALKRKWGNIAAQAFLRSQGCDSVDDWKESHPPLAYAYVLADWHVKFTRDADNVGASIKPVLDALTLKGVGVFEDDNLGHLNLRHAYWELSKYPGEVSGECCHIWISSEPLVAQTRFCPAPPARLLVRGERGVRCVKS
jgi:hypothetical protein